MNPAASKIVLVGDKLTLCGQTDVLQLPIQYSLIDQVILDDQDMRFRTGRLDRGLARVTLLERWSLTRVLSFVYSTLGLGGSGLDKETECGAFTVLGCDLYTTPH